MDRRLNLDLPLQDAVRDGAGRLLASARATISDALLADPNVHSGRHALDEAVHDVRRRLKETRALLRLVRPGLGEEVYASENTALRDLGRILSDVRDAAAVVETWDAHADEMRGMLGGDGFVTVRLALVARLDALHEEVPVSTRLRRVDTGLLTAGLRLSALELPTGTFQDVGEGLGRTWERGRNALDAAEASGTPEAFHEWRKRAKYHRYHCDMLRPLWPMVLQVREGELHTLTDLLGEANDLSVLRSIVDAERLLQDGVADAFDEATSGRLASLQEEALRQGRRMYSERTELLVERFEAMWEAAQE